MNVIVTGGAGYIGSATVEALRQRGDRVAVIDALITGHRKAVDPAVRLHEIDLRDLAAVRAAFDEERPDAVVHFAASSLVGESMADPAKYMENNVGGTLNLLQAMKEGGVRHIVFSSTAATYGEPKELPLRESHPAAPTSVYGLTKRMIEQVLETYAAAYGMRFAALRYFNAAGATATRGEDHKPESHLIPLVLQVALGQRPHISIFGTDYDTPDGTCVRDYIHIADLADAHLRALDYLAGGGAPVICNLGNGLGFSVREVVDACRRISGREIPVKEEPRRPGDPSRLVADASRAREVLGWQPRHAELDGIVRDAWAWHSAHPKGY